MILDKTMAQGRKFSEKVNNESNTFDPIQSFIFSSHIACKDCLSNGSQLYNNHEKLFCELLTLQKESR